MVINALSFPAIVTLFLEFLEHQAKRESEDTSTEGQTEKAGQCGHRNNPQKRPLNRDPMRHVRLSASFWSGLTLDSRTSDCDKQSYTLEYSTVSLPHQSCAHLKGTFVPFVYSRLYHNQQSLFDACHYNEQNSVCDWSNIHCVFL